MEAWFVYALLSSIFAGLYSFFLKISAEKNHNTPLVIAYSMLSASALALFVHLFSREAVTMWVLLATVSIAESIFYFIATATRVESLRNIDTTLYFPIYKTGGPILMVLVSMIAFQESLTLNQGIGILMGVAVPLLLISKREHRRQKNIKKGLAYLVVGTVFGVAASSMSKIVTLNNLNIMLFMFIAFLGGGVLSLVVYYLRPGHGHSTDRIRRTGIANGTMLFVGTYFFIQSTVGNLGVVYTINSFSLLVPILLSVIVYNEHFDLRKGIAVLLTLVSLGFLR